MKNYRILLKKVDSYSVSLNFQSGNEFTGLTLEKNFVSREACAIQYGEGIKTVMGDKEEGEW